MKSSGAPARGNRSKLSTAFPHVVDLQPRADEDSDAVVLVRNEKRESIPTNKWAKEILRTRSEGAKLPPTVREREHAATARSELAVDTLLFEIRGVFVRRKESEQDLLHPAIFLGVIDSSCRVFFVPDEDCARLHGLLQESDEPNCKVFYIRSREGLLFATYTLTAVPAGSSLTIARRTSAANSSTQSKSTRRSVGSSTAEVLPMISEGMAQEFVRQQSCHTATASFSTLSGTLSGKSTGHSVALEAIAAVRRHSMPDILSSEQAALLNDFRLKEVRSKMLVRHEDMESSAGVSMGSNESVEKHPRPPSRSDSSKETDASRTDARETKGDNQKHPRSSIERALVSLQAMLRTPGLDDSDKVELSKNCVDGLINHIRLLLHKKEAVKDNESCKSINLQDKI